MNEIRQSTFNHMRIAFWRVIASCLGWAIHWRSSLLNPTSHAPYILAAATSYFMGRVLAGLILRIWLS